MRAVPARTRPAGALVAVVLVALVLLASAPALGAPDDAPGTTSVSEIVPRQAPPDATLPEAADVAAEVRAGEQADARIAAAVTARLLRHPALQQVTVEVNAGSVTLGGEVLENADRERAATLAKQVEGVADVDNEIGISAALQPRINAALDQVRGKLLRLVVAIPLLVVAIAIVLLAVLFGRMLAHRPMGWLRRHRDNPYLEALVRRLVQAVVVILGLVLALNLLGATALVGAVLGSAGVIGLVVGFAFKDIAENYVAGVLLSLRRPFAPGEHLRIEGFEGKVAALTSRATIMVTMEGNHLSLPNALVFKSVVLNYSANSRRRFEFVLPIDTAQSIRDAREMGLAAIARVDGVLADPAPSCVVDGYNAKGLDLRFHGWIDQRSNDLGKTRSEALRAVKAVFGAGDVHGPETVRYLREDNSAPVVIPPRPDRSALPPLRNPSSRE